MDYLPVAALVIALLIIVWLLVSMWGTKGFDPAIMPRYPSATMQEQMNSGTTPTYNIYPRVPYGTTFTNM